MAYVITEPCVDVKDKSCINVCPVDCIYESGEADRQMYINPDECIDCGACEPECPVSAIFAEEEVPANFRNFIPINQLYFKDQEAARAEVNRLCPEKRQALEV
ncbi:MAG: ferredoxin [Chloroflexi bacterium]|jgi:ferredoxin|nr:ferredoxin [Chloroflexota bacterium]